MYNICISTKSQCPQNKNNMSKSWICKLKSSEVPQRMAQKKDNTKNSEQEPRLILAGDNAL